MQGSFLSIRSLLVIAVALSALLLATGCGDSDDSATGSSGGNEEVSVETGSLSKAAFIKRVEPLCQQTLGQLETELQGTWQKAMENPRKPTETTLEEEYFEKEFAELYEKLIDNISALGAPAGDEQEIAAYLETMQEGIDEAAGDHEVFSEDFLGREAVFKGTSKLTRAYGLNGCP